MKPRLVFSVQPKRKGFLDFFHDYSKPIWSRSKHILLLGVMPRYVAKRGNPIVPVTPLVSLVTKAISGAKSEVKWERFEVKEINGMLSIERT